MQKLSSYVPTAQAPLRQMSQESGFFSSEQDRAAEILEHAMAYLVLNRFKRLRGDHDANRKAVKILCDARDILEHFAY